MDATILKNSLVTWRLMRYHKTWSKTAASVVITRKKNFRQICLSLWLLIVRTDHQEVEKVEMRLCFVLDSGNARLKISASYIKFSPRSKTIFERLGYSLRFHRAASVIILPILFNDRDRNYTVLEYNTPIL